jgi:thymidylate synthase (FAD)
LTIDSAEAGQNYQRLLDANLSRELARMSLTLNTYTQWYWKIDLHNLFNFLGLRMDHHAQYEIQVYAEAIARIVKQWCPIAYQAFLDYRFNAVTLSDGAMAVVRRMLDGESVSEAASGLSRREYKDIMAVLEVAPRKE